MKDDLPILSDVAIAYSKRHAEKLFEGRRGHGKGAPGSRVLSRTEIEINLAVAYQLGAQMAATLGKVRS